MTTAQRATAVGRRRITSGAAWGNNTHVQLGSGWDCNLITQPVGMLLNNVAQLVSGYFATVALRTDGTVWSWGNGTLLAREHVEGTQSLPVEAEELTNVVAIAGVGDHALALLGNGEVRAWGANRWGEAGKPVTEGEGGRYHKPQTILTSSGGTPLDGITAIATGQFHCLAVTESGEVAAWGNNADGQLGNGETGKEVPYPVYVEGLSERVIALAGGGRDTSATNGGHSLALLENGTVMAWGYNAMGQLGNGSTTDTDKAVAVEGLANVIAIAAAGQNSYAVVKEGATTKLMAWGGNEAGQLGIGKEDTEAHSKPVEVKMPAGAITYVSAGQANYVPFGNWALAVCAGKAVSWGSNGSGQLGYETELKEYEQLGSKVKRMSPNSTPKEIPMPEGAGQVISVAAGEEHALAILVGPGPSRLLASTVVGGATPEALELRWEWDTEDEGKEWTFEVEVVHSDAEKKKAKKEKIKFKKGTLRASLSSRTLTIHGSEVPEWKSGENFRAEVRLKAAKGEGETNWIDKGVSTATSEEEETPTVETKAASSVTEASAKLNGTVEGNEVEVTECFFEYGPSETELSKISVALPEGEEAEPVSATVTGLTAKATYYFRIVAVYAGGRAEGSFETFTTT
jgi:alpha-tubulin suppressor-like RCC1 family protein